jgi:hypothetical protein
LRDDEGWHFMSPMTPANPRHYTFHISISLKEAIKICFFIGRNLEIKDSNFHHTNSKHGKSN